MIKLRHLCLRELQECPPELKDDLRWEVENELSETKIKLNNIESSLENLRSRVCKPYSTVNKKLTKNIHRIEDEISVYLFDTWIARNENEEIWMEYFFCLYDFMISEKNYVDLSNIRLLSEDSVKIYDTLKRPMVYQSTDVRILDYKFLELYNVFKNIVVPDIPSMANETLAKNIEITKQMARHRKNILNLKNEIGFYEELLSSSLCSRK